jgi:hypothetical protein
MSDRRLMLSQAQALFLCALAVAGAIQITLNQSRPFEGVIRVSDQPLRHALDAIGHLKSYSS